MVRSRTSGMMFMVMPPTTTSSGSPTGALLIDNTPTSNWIDDNSNTNFVDDAGNFSQFPASSPTNMANLIWKATGGTADRSNAARWANQINVMDFGATGDGVTDDRAAIQAALNYIQSGALTAFGRYSIAALYFPPGNYRIASFGTDGSGNHHGLIVNDGKSDPFHDLCLLGNTSATTRIFYDVVNDFVAGHNTALMQFDDHVDDPFIFGIHFDMLPAFGANVPGDNARGNTMAVWNLGRNDHNAGRKGTYVDCRFSGGVFGIAEGGGGDALGSETQWLWCKFDQCNSGWVSFGANQLGYTFLGGYATNNNRGGIVAQQGGVSQCLGMHFFNGSTVSSSDPAGDFSNQNANAMSLVGCTSTSTSFIIYANGTNYIGGNYHNPGSSGGIFALVKSGPMVFDNNMCTSTSAAVTNSGSNIYLRGNTFGSTGFLAGYSSGLVKENI